MLEINEQKGVIVAQFKDQDRFNASVSEPAKETLLSYFNKPNTKLIINLEGIKFIDSSGFSVFLSVMKVANNNYGELKICSVSPEVKELFELLQLHNIFDIFDSFEECLASLSN